MKHGLARGILAGIFALACSSPLSAQRNFSFSGCELAFENLTSLERDLSIALAGFVFNEDLLYDDQYSYPQVTQLQTGKTAGYNAPYRAGQGDTGVDITTYQGTIGAGEFTVTFGTKTFTLNLIDANYAAGNTFRVLFELTQNGPATDLTAYVASPTASDPMSCDLSITIQNNDYVYLRDLIRSATGGGSAFTNYKRDRGSLATRIFELGGGAIPRYGIDNARLDVNCRVTGTLQIPATNYKTVDVEGFTDSLYSGELNTAWYFDDDHKLQVDGILLAGTTVSGSGIYFTSSSGSPVPGIWGGVEFWNSPPSAARNLWINYARSAVSFVDHASVSTFEDCVFTNNLYHGIVMSSSNPSFDAVTVSNSNDDGVRISGQDSGPWLTGCLITNNDGCGILVENDAYAYILRCQILENDLHGVSVFTNAWPTIDICAVTGNGESGVYTYENSYKWTTVRHSTIGTNDWWGLHNVSNGYLRAYAAPPGMTDPEDIAMQPDSIGRNCVIDNAIENLYGDQNSIFEMARAYEAPDGGGTMRPHYQGDSNSVVYTSVGQAQGTMVNGSYAWVMQDWWNGNTLFTLLNGGSGYVDPELGTNPRPDCGEEDGPSGRGVGAIAGTASPYDSRAWWQRAGDPPAMKQYLQAQLAALGAGDLNYGLFMLGRAVDSLQMDVFCRTLLAATKDADKRAVALAHLGKSLMSQRRYGDAVAVYDEITALSVSKINSRHTSAQGMAAIMVSYAGNKAAGLARLDTALGVFPADRQLLAAWHLLGGGPRTGTPKRASAAGLPAGYALGEAYPNPFSGSSVIPFTVPERSAVRITVHNALGATVAVPADGAFDSGAHSAEWNAEGLASGLYFVTMRVGSHMASRSILLTR